MCKNSNKRPDNYGDEEGSCAFYGVDIRSTVSASKNVFKDFKKAFDRCASGNQEGVFLYLLPNTIDSNQLFEVQL